MERRNYILLFSAMFFSFTASADHGIQAMGDAMIEIVLFLLAAVIGGGTFVLFAILRLTLKKKLLSIGAYIGATFLLLYLFRNYITTLNERGTHNYYHIEDRAAFHLIWLSVFLVVAIGYFILDLNLISREKRRHHDSVKSIFDDKEPVEI